MRLGYHPKTEFKKGHKVSEECKRKISNFRKSFTGWHHSEKTKQKMSITAKKIGYHNSPEGIKRSLLAAHKIIKNNHPKGMLGKHHSIEFKEKMSERIKSEWKNFNSKFNTPVFRQKLSDRMILNRKNGIYNNKNQYSRCKRGYYNINGEEMYFRSKWEANYALYLDYLIEKKQILKWEYEAQTFWFEKIKRGVRSYTPDFKVIQDNGIIEYHEVKGWMDNKSRTKLKRMVKYFPEIKIILIDSEQYKSIMKWKNLFIKRDDSQIKISHHYTYYNKINPRIEMKIKQI